MDLKNRSTERLNSASKAEQLGDGRDRESASISWRQMMRSSDMWQFLHHGVFRVLCMALFADKQSVSELLLPVYK